MTQIYETLVLLDNDVVRADWKKAKAIVTDTVAKYGGTLHTCRRWDERRLAYPIKRKNRATFYIAYLEMPGDTIPGFLRDFELNERVLRYLMTRVEELPEEEAKLAAEEDGTEYEVPAPPEDDAIEVVEDEEQEGEGDAIEIEVPDIEAANAVDGMGGDFKRNTEEA